MTCHCVADSHWMDLIPSQAYLWNVDLTENHTVIIFRSSPPSRPNKVGLKCPSARPYVSPSTKGVFDFIEIWCVGRGRRVMHDGMQYDPIQRQGHDPLKVGNSAIFKGYLFPHFQWGLQLTNHGFLNWGAIPKAYQGRISVFFYSFCVTWLCSWQ